MKLIQHENMKDYVEIEPVVVEKTGGKGKPIITTIKTTEVYSMGKVVCNRFGVEGIKVDDIVLFDPGYVRRFENTLGKKPLILLKKDGITCRIELDKDEIVENWEEHYVKMQSIRESKEYTSIKQY